MSFPLTEFSVNVSGRQAPVKGPGLPPRGKTGGDGPPSPPRHRMRSAEGRGEMWKGDGGVRWILQLCVNANDYLDLNVFGPSYFRVNLLYSV
jgi:hypothetical protein